jgi:hypothetical protein
MIKKEAMLNQIDANRKSNPKRSRQAIEEADRILEEEAKAEGKDVPMDRATQKLILQLTSGVGEDISKLATIEISVESEEEAEVVLK